MYIGQIHNLKKAEKIIFNSKLRRTSICGIETLLIHKSVKKNDIKHILEKLNNHTVKLLV